VRGLVLRVKPVSFGNNDSIALVNINVIIGVDRKKVGGGLFVGLGLK
jgi:hypothetical protein